MANFVQQFHELQSQKQQVEDELNRVEKQIYDTETEYLEETLQASNILRGWDGYLGTQNSSGAIRRINRFREADRLFSMSSVTSNAAGPNAKAAPVNSSASKLKKGRKRDRDESES